MATAPAKKPAGPKTAAAKPTAAKAPSAKSGAAKTPIRPAAKLVANTAPTDDPAARSAPRVPTKGATLKARDLIARVAEVIGGKPKDVKAMVEATLAELGKALDAGETLVLPPLGKLRITPAKAEGGHGPMKLKLKRGAMAGGKKKVEKEPLAEGRQAS